MAIEAGAELGPLVVESVSAERMKTLARVLDDPNPIHLDPAAAKELGLGDRVVNQGPANVGYVIDMLAAAQPGAALRDLEVRFLANVFAEDRCSAAGRVESVEDSDVERLARCSVWLDVDGGGRALEGTATLVL
jgi:3-hydroxybutyryl-CoA dehydratase